MMKILKATNENIKTYKPGSVDRANLIEKYDELSSKIIDIPITINGEEIRTGNFGYSIIPHNHKHILAKYHKAGKKEITHAIETSLKSWQSWSKTSLLERTNVFRKAAKLLSGPWRDILNASTMLNQSKNVHQAEIDSACELIDFYNFNCQFAEQIYSNQSLISPKGTKNYFEYRSLEGFVFTITPFNFTSISGNLPTAPAIMGNVSIWKPASSAVYSSFFINQLLIEAGLPKGVINFIPGAGDEIGNIILKNKNLAGVHFTGSSQTFQNIFSKIGSNINNYKNYPRIVGETGGKGYCLVHESANHKVLIASMIRGAFEYQGQKCSALSRAYIPVNLWEKIKTNYINEIHTIKVGSPRNCENFINAVIDKKAFNSIKTYINHAKNSNDAKIITGGTYDDSKGYFITPTTIITLNPYFKTMVEEIFGPVLTIYLYKPNEWKSIISLVDKTSPYGLTGSVIGQDKIALEEAKKGLVHSAGNFYINDKPTGAVVGQQPFGGARSSGTNDKAGSIFNLQRWISIRTVKEHFQPPSNYRYPFLKNN